MKIYTASKNYLHCWHCGEEIKEGERFIITREGFFKEGHPQQIDGGSYDTASSSAAA